MIYEDKQILAISLSKKKIMEKLDKDNDTIMFFAGKQQNYYKILFRNT